jgi:hypothetical protein
MLHASRCGQQGSRIRIGRQRRSRLERFLIFLDRFGELAGLVELIGREIRNFVGFRFPEPGKQRRPREQLWQVWRAVVSISSGTDLQTAKESGICAPDMAVISVLSHRFMAVGVARRAATIAKLPA